MMEQAALRGSSTGRGLTRVLALVLLPLAILSVLTYSCVSVLYIPQNTGTSVVVAMNTIYMCLSLMESVIGIVFAIGAFNFVSEGRRGGLIAASTLFIIVALGSVTLSVVTAAVETSGWDRFVSLLLEDGMTLVSNIILAVIAFILLHWFRTGSNPRTARVAAILSLILACANEAFYVTIVSDVEFITMFDSIILYVAEIVMAMLMISLTFVDDPLKGFAACLTVFGFTTVVMAVCGCVGTASNAMDFVAEHPSYRDYASQFLVAYLVSISSIVFECVIFIFLGFSATRRAAGKPASGFIAAMVMAMVFAIPAIALSVWQIMITLGGYGSSSTGLAMLLVELVAQIVMLASAAALIGSTKPAENHTRAMTAAALWSIVMLVFATMGIFVMVGDPAGIFTTSTRLSGIVAEVLSAIVMPLVVCGLKSLPQPQTPQPQSFTQPQPQTPQQPQPFVQPMATASAPAVPLIPRMPVAPASSETWTVADVPSPEEPMLANSEASMPASEDAAESGSTAAVLEAAVQEATVPEVDAQEAAVPEAAAPEVAVAEAAVPEAHRDHDASDCEVSDLGTSGCVLASVAMPDEESDERHDDVSADGEDK